MTAINISNLCKTYGRTPVLHNISLNIASGEFLVILGPSGCGKSSLLRMIAGLEEITGGEVTIGDRVVNRLEPRERGCAMVFQNYALYPHMSVAENIGYALKVAGIAAAERRKRVVKIATSLGLADFLDRKPAELSGGQRQRVAMGRAMIREPQVFLFDEPLSNLDARLRVQMRIEIRKLHNRLGTTSIFVTHDQIEAMTLADRVVVMNGGRIEQLGTPEEIYREPATRFVAGFIGAPPMNLMDAVVTGSREVGIGAFRLAVESYDLPVGSRVTVGIRPEEVIVGTGRADAPQVDIDFCEELGATRLLHGRMAGHEFAIQVPASGAAMRFGHFMIDVPARAIHLFDNQTGMRIARKEGALASAA